jgi:hypothetical protein
VQIRRISRHALVDHQAHRPRIALPQGDIHAIAPGKARQRAGPLNKRDDDSTAGFAPAADSNPWLRASHWSPDLFLPRQISHQAALGV